MIGLQQTSYTVDEVDGTLALCMEVISGDVDGRNIVINYVTSSGTATGKPYISHGGLKHVILLFLNYSWK